MSRAKKQSETSSNSGKVEGVIADYVNWLSKHPRDAIAVAAIQALTGVVKRSSATTIMGLEIELQAAADRLKSYSTTLKISVSAGCELFIRYVTRTSNEIPDFDKCKARLIQRGEEFSDMSMRSKQTISDLVGRFIQDGAVVLLHGYSRVVTACCLHAAARGKNFSVIVTEGRPDCSGYQTASELSRQGIPVTLILDAAVASHMDRIHLVLLGAQALVENGGIINKLGTFQIALVAKALKRPVYVAAESYKFARLFPLSQDDILRAEGSAEANTTVLPRGKKLLFGHPFEALPWVPAASVVNRVVEPKKKGSKNDSEPMPGQVVAEAPTSDYTPPQYITSLFTDLGILTPSAVSDELIKLYF